MTGASDPAEARRSGALEITATVVVRAPQATVFAALTNWERQGEWIPFTRVRVVAGDGGEGSRVEAVTAFGPTSLRDEMRVVRMDPPYQVQVVHCGRVLRGPGVLRCTALGDDRAQVAWHEWFQVPGGLAGKLAGSVLWPGSKLGLTQALRRFAKLVEAGRLP